MLSFASVFLVLAKQTFDSKIRKCAQKEDKQTFDSKTFECLSLSRPNFNLVLEILFFRFFAKVCLSREKISKHIF